MESESEKILFRSKLYKDLSFVPFAFATLFFILALIPKYVGFPLDNLWEKMLFPLVFVLQAITLGFIFYSLWIKRKLKDIVFKNKYSSRLDTLASIVYYIAILSMFGRIFLEDKTKTIFWKFQVYDILWVILFLLCLILSLVVKFIEKNASNKLAN